MSRVVPQDVVARIKDETDIVEVVRQYVSLKLAGASFKGLCPFHTEKTPSFIVTPARQMYKCFGCGEGGDVISFLMSIEAISFPEALETLARPLDIDLSNLLRDDESEGERRAYHRANEVAAEFWQATLWDDRRGAIARRYLQERGFGEEILQRFKIGYAPPGSEAFTAALKKQGVSEDLALQSGLLRRKERQAPFAYFRQRVIFPVENISRQVAGFGGRVIDQGEPKYLNSSDSTYFSKGKLLYGFAASRMPIARLKTAILVEGYLDLLALAQGGYANVVATCGTALTTDQARLLRRGCRTVVLLFDGDRAGLQAAVRACHNLLSVGLEPKVASLPAGEDPDSLLRDRGAEAMQTVLRDAVGYLPFLASVAAAKAPGRQGQERALRQALGSIAEVADPIRREYLLQEAAQLFSVGLDVLHEAVADRQDGSRQDGRRSTRRSSQRSPEQADEQSEPPPGAGPARSETGVRFFNQVNAAAVEAEMFAHLLRDESGEAARVFAAQRDSLKLASPETERLADEILRWLGADDDKQELSPAEFVQQRWNEQPDERYRKYVSGLLVKEGVPDKTDFTRVIQDCLQRLTASGQPRQ